MSKGKGEERFDPSNPQSHWRDSAWFGLAGAVLIVLLLCACVGAAAQACVWLAEGVAGSQGSLVRLAGHCVVLGFKVLLGIGAGIMALIALYFAMDMAADAREKRMQRRRDAERVQRANRERCRL